MAPAVREICAQLGLSGPACIHRILGIFKDQGYIISEPGKKHSWRTRVENTGQGIPLVGTIAAGVPLEAIENLEEELAVSPGLFGCTIALACGSGETPWSIVVREFERARAAMAISSSMWASSFILESTTVTSGWFQTQRRAYSTCVRVIAFQCISRKKPGNGTGAREMPFPGQGRGDQGNIRSNSKKRSCSRITPATWPSRSTTMRRQRLTTIA